MQQETALMDHSPCLKAGGAVGHAWVQCLFYTQSPNRISSICEPNAIRQTMEPESGCVHLPWGGVSRQ
jgi:hypothetical protein